MVVQNFICKYETGDRAWQQGEYFTFSLFYRINDSAHPANVLVSLCSRFDGAY